MESMRVWTAFVTENVRVSSGLCLTVRWSNDQGRVRSNASHEDALNRKECEAGCENQQNWEGD
jgi:hypothetical protein